MTEATKEESATSASNPSIDFLYDIEVDLSFEIGRKKIKLKELIQLKQNSIVELDKAAGDPLEIFANGSLVAKGEVVIVNERYGVRLTEVVSKQERMKNV